MNKTKKQKEIQKELKKRTLNYFVRQKVLEIGGLIIGILLLVLIIYLLGNWTWAVNLLGFAEEVTLVRGCLFLLILMIMCFMFYLVGGFLYLFIQYNWEKAHDKAVLEIKREHRNKGWKNK